MKRRDFLGYTSSAIGMAFLQAHETLALSQPGIRTTPNIGLSTISGLRLQTSTQLHSMRYFYHELLEFPLVEEKAAEITFQAGETALTFVKTPASKNPFYHFAFNIPENKIRSARDWQLKRTALQPSPDHLVDQGYTEDIRHFKSWNAHSIFFWDPAGNLVEYIARHDLANTSPTNSFTTKDISCVSEIAFIVNDVDWFAQQLKAKMNVEQYRNSTGEFQAVGNELGLLLVMRKGRLWERHTRRIVTPDTHETTVTIRSEVAGAKWIPDNYPYKFLTDWSS